LSKFRASWSAHMRLVLKDFPFLPMTQESKMRTPYALTPRNMCPLQGEAGPFERSHHHIKSNREPSNHNPTKDNPPSIPTKYNLHPTNQGQPPSHHVTKVPNNLHTLLFQFHIIFMLSCLHRTFLTPQLSSKPLRASVG
jgi:hypothetical protein